MNINSNSNDNHVVNNISSKTDFSSETTKPSALETLTESQVNQSYTLTCETIPILSFEDITQISRVIATLDAFSKKTSIYSDTVINDRSFKIRTDTPTHFNELNIQLFTPSDYDSACLNFTQPCDVRSFLDVQRLHAHDSTTTSVLPITDVDDAANSNMHQLTDPHVDATIDTDFLNSDVNYSASDILAWQLADERLTDLRTYLKNKIVPTDAIKAKRIVAESACYFIDPQTDLLYHLRQHRCKKPKSRNDNFEAQIVIPKSKTENILIMAHDSLYGIHASAEKVYLKLARWCYWDNMYADIRNHCINCVNCQKGKSGLKIKHPPLVNLAHVTEPFTVYIIDFLKLSLTSKSNVYLLTVVDRACNMAHLFPCHDQSAETTARCLYTSIIANFGVMSVLQSDRAAAFLGNVMKILTQTYGIRHVTGSSRHPQTSGKVERYHRTIVNILRCLPNAQNRWDDFIPAIQLSLRAVPSKALAGFTPSECAWGKNVRTPDQQIAHPPLETPRNLEQYMTNLQEQLSLTQKIVAEGRMKYLESMKNQYDKGTTTNRFELNDLVLLKTEYFNPKLQPKLCERFSGPYKIIDSNIAYNSYKLQDVQTGKTSNKFVHACKIKRFHSNTDIPTQTNRVPRKETEPGTQQSPTETPAPHIEPTPATTESPRTRRSQRLLNKQKSQVTNEVIVNTSPTRDSTKKSQQSRKSILKKNIEPQTTHFASFKIAGRPKDGKPRTTKIKIIRFIHSRKIHGNLEFYVELDQPYNGRTFVWVSEFFVTPPLSGIRTNKKPNF